MVDMAQLVRAPGCGPGGRRFESDYPPHRKKQVDFRLAFLLYIREPISKNRNKKVNAVDLSIYRTGLDETFFRGYNDIIGYAVIMRNNF